MLRRLSLRGIRAHKMRFAMTTFAVVMGVGFVVGSFVVTDSLRQSVHQLFDDVTRGVDVSVRAETSLDSDTLAGSRGRIPDDLVEVVRAVEGVAAAEGTIGGYAQLIGPDGEPLTSMGAPFLGVSWGEEDALYPVTLDEGRKPSGRDEIAIDRGTAEGDGFAVGDRTRVLLADGTQPEVEIVGIFTFGDANNLLGARITAFDAVVAQELFGSPGEIDTVDVVAAPGVTPAELAARIDAVLPDGAEVVTNQEYRDEAVAGVQGFLDVFRSALLGFAAVAVFVSAFYINNTFSIIVSQRTRELALLRALGASRRQVMASVAVEAVAVGLLASVVGVGFGLLIAVVLQAILAAGGIELPSQALVLTARTLLAAAIVGVGVTLVASLTPARRASSIPPISGMRDGVLPAPRSRRGRLVIGLGLTAGGAALVMTGLAVADGTTQVVGTLGLGSMALFVGVAQLSPLVAVPVAGVLGRPVAPLFRVAGKLAHSNAVRNPERTARTAAALMIGLALVTMVWVVGASMKQTFAESIDDAVRADLVVSAPVGFSPAATEAIAVLPEVDAATGVRTSRFLFNGRERDLVAIDPATAGALVDIDVIDGSLTDLGPGSIVVHRDPARDLGLSVGDQVTVELASGGPQQLEVAAIHGDSTYAGNYVIDLATFAAHYPVNDLDLFAFARLADGVPADEGRAAVEATLRPFPQVTLEDRAEFRASQEAQFDNLLLMINGLLGLALLIALLGIANTLALSVMERTREIGLLRAVGMLRGQARRMVLTESAMVAVFGAALGIGIGLVLGLAAASALPPSAVATVVVPVATLATIVLVAAVCGVLAGMVPARRAARLDVLRAISTE
jgi:putative ABC transport system permease protein